MDPTQPQNQPLQPQPPGVDPLPPNPLPPAEPQLPPSPNAFPTQGVPTDTLGGDPMLAAQQPSAAFPPSQPNPPMPSAGGPVGPEPSFSVPAVPEAPVPAQPPLGQDLGGTPQVPPASPAGPQAPELPTNNGMSPSPEGGANPVATPSLANIPDATHSGGNGKKMMGVVIVGVGVLMLFVIIGIVIAAL